MNLYTKNEYYTIYQGSMLDLLDHIESNTIDSVVTDPPYELNFMNKGWDRSGIAFQKETWEKTYKALKPGGYLLAFGGSRTFHRIAVAIEDAGFEIRDVVMWVYGSGFPKSLDISKAIDKSMGAERTKKIEKVRNPKTTGNGHDGTKGATRPFIEKALKENNGLYEIDDDTPVSDEAKQWQGWGTALKPAYEPIIVARKPLKGTVAQNVMKYGVGGINIDECRVALDGEKQPKGSGGSVRNSATDQKWGFVGNGGNETSQYGRFPANFIHDGSQEVTALFPESNGGTGETKEYGAIENDIRLNASKVINRTSFCDSGNASRFFYTAKASKKDRDEGLKLFETKLFGQSGGAQKALENGESEYIQKDHIGLNKIKERKNVHPTVKPCELMQYLVRMVTPKGGTVLDPFMGSGSTGKATMFENRERNANYKFIGIDLDMDNMYCEIANARIDYALNKFVYDEQEIRERDKAKGQLNIFDFMD